MPLGVLDHDEVKPAECVLIMENYTKYLPKKDDGPVETILWGDGLSCKRIRDGQRIRQNGGNRWRKLCGFVPAAQDWHKRCLLLQVGIDSFSVQEIWT